MFLYNLRVTSAKPSPVASLQVLQEVDNGEERGIRSLIHLHEQVSQQHNMECITTKNADWRTSWATSNGVFLALFFNDLAPPSIKVLAISISLQYAAQCNNLEKLGYNGRKEGRGAISGLRGAVLSVRHVDYLRHDLYELRETANVASHDVLLASLPGLGIILGIN